MIEMFIPDYLEPINNCKYLANKAYSVGEFECGENKEGRK
jgi:hypothetical protein